MLLHYTKDIHKLIEFTGRTCYQSYDKVNEESHKMLRGIMGKGHLSVASVGNIVFGFKFDSQLSLMSAFFDLIKMNRMVKLGSLDHFAGAHCAPFPERFFLLGIYTTFWLFAKYEPLTTGMTKVI